MEDSCLITDSAFSSYNRCFRQINSFEWGSDCAKRTSSPIVYNFMDTRQKSYLVSGIENILTLHFLILLFFPLPSVPIYICFFFSYIIHIFVQWYKALLNLNLNFLETMFV